MCAYHSKCTVDHLNCAKKCVHAYTLLGQVNGRFKRRKVVLYSETPNGRTGVIRGWQSEGKELYSKEHLNGRTEFTRLAVGGKRVVF